MFKFENGQTVRDRITGLTGIIMCRVQYATGCIQYGITPTKLLKDGKLPEWTYLDEARLEIKRGFMNKLKDRGGPCPTPPQMN
jgi:hypothetical protein